MVQELDFVVERYVLFYGGYSAIYIRSHTTTIAVSLRALGKLFSTNILNKLKSVQRMIHAAVTRG